MSGVDPNEDIVLVAWWSAGLGEKIFDKVNELETRLPSLQLQDKGTFHFHKELFRASNVWVHARVVYRGALIGYLLVFTNSSAKLWLYKSHKTDIPPAVFHALGARTK